jgi:hypothetical protein
LFIDDGMVKGAGNDLMTPQIRLSMMKEFVIPPNKVEPHSYAAFAEGHKRHNMPQVYVGFYDYDDATIECSKQQRMPTVLVAKCGNLQEVNDPKPGKRGKRDSKIVLMTFQGNVRLALVLRRCGYEGVPRLGDTDGVVQGAQPGNHGGDESCEQGGNVCDHVAGCVFCCFSHTSHKPTHFNFDSTTSCTT